MGRYTGGSSAGLGKAQRIDSSLRDNWLSCFCLAWWEWRVARQCCLVPLWKRGMWNPTGLLASHQRVWLFGRIAWSAGSRLWVGYQPRFKYQWGCRCQDVTIPRVSWPASWPLPVSTGMGIPRILAAMVVLRSSFSRGLSLPDHKRYHLRCELLCFQ